MDPTQSIKPTKGELVGVGLDVCVFVGVTDGVTVLLGVFVGV